jgi:carbohydrate kinase (thermoresistant glucokinase family)
MGASGSAGIPGIVTCSALKKRYCDAIIGSRGGVQLVYLAGSPALISGIIAGRHAHFMPASVLESQFATLEPPTVKEDPIVAPIDEPVAAIVDHIVTALSSRRASMMVPA